MAKESIRISLDLSPEANKNLERMAEIIHGSKSDLLRQAAALLDVALKAETNGKEFVLAKPGQASETQAVGLSAP